MNDEMFIKKYEELLDKGYCDCNEMNCIDNNTPRRILNVVKNLQQENQQLKNQLKIKHNGFMASVDESCDLAKENQKYKEAINKIKEVCNSIPSTHTICGIEKIHDIENILKEVE